MPVLIEITTPDARYASRASDTVPSSSGSRSHSGSPGGASAAWCAWSPSSREPLTRRAPVPPISCRAPLRLPPTIPTSFSGKLVGSFLQHAVALRGARMGPHDSPFSLAPPWFSPRVSPILPPNPPLILPLTCVSGGFTGELSGTSTGSKPSPVTGPASVRSWPGTGSAGTRRRLRLFAKRAAGRGFLAHSPSGPGSARPRPGGTPLAPRPTRWTRRTWAIHPAARSRLLRGVASRDHPQGNPHYHSGPRRWTRLSLGGGHGSLLLHTLAPSFPHSRGACCGTFFDVFARAGTAQPTNPGGVAGARPPVASAWGPSRWSSGRPSHPLGRVAPGSFPSKLSLHVNRIGGRSAGAALTA